METVTIDVEKVVADAYSHLDPLLDAIAKEIGFRPNVTFDPEVRIALRPTVLVPGSTLQMLRMTYINPATKGSVKAYAQKLVGYLGYSIAGKQLSAFWSQKYSAATYLKGEEEVYSTVQPAEMVRPPRIIEILYPRQAALVNRAIDKRDGIDRRKKSDTDTPTGRAIELGKISKRRRKKIDAALTEYLSAQDGRIIDLG